LETNILTDDSESKDSAATRSNAVTVLEAKEVIDPQEFLRRDEQDRQLQQNVNGRSYAALQPANENEFPPPTPEQLTAFINELLEQGYPAPASINNLRRFLLRQPLDFWLFSSCVLRRSNNPMQFDHVLGHIHWLQSSLAVPHIITKKIWPWVLLGLMTNDFVNYFVYPNLRYGNTPLAIFLGTSPNQLSISTTLFSDLVMGTDQTDAWKFLLPFAVLSLPPAFYALETIHTLIQCCTKRYRHSAPTVSTVSESVISDQYTTAGFFIDTLRGLPCHPLHRTINDIGFSVLWDRRDQRRRVFWHGDENELAMKHLTWVRELVLRALMHRSLLQLQILQILIEVADNYQQDFPDLANGLIQVSACALAPSATDIRRATRILALQALKLFSHYYLPQVEIQALCIPHIDREKYHVSKDVFFLRPLPRFIFVNHALWTLNQSRLKKLLPLFLVATALYLYAELRYWSTQVLKSMAIGEFIDAIQSCHKAGKIFQYIDDIGNYACMVCPDWEFVRLDKRYSAQGCLDGLLRSSLSPEEILTNLARLLKHSGLNAIDFSQQDLSAWTEQEWDLFLNQFLQIPLQTLALFNLSNSASNNAQVSLAKIQSLMNFLRRVTVQKLDLMNQALGAAFTQLMPSLFNNVTEYLDLTGIRLTENETTAIAGNIGTALRWLILTNNQIGDNGVLLLSAAMANSSLTHIVMNNIVLGDVGLQALAIAFVNTARNMTILAANNFFTYLSMDAIGRTFGWAVSAISLANSGLEESAVIILSPYLGNLQSADLSDNSITDTAMAVLAPAIQNSTSLLRLVLRNTGLSGFSLSLLTASFPIVLRILDLSGNQNVGGQLVALVMNLPPALQSLILADIEMGDVAATSLVERLLNTSHPLRELDVSGNSLTITSGLQIIQLLIHGTLMVLNLSRNMLAGIGQSLAAVLPHSHATSLDLRETSITDDDLEAIAPALAASPLENFAVGGESNSNNEGLVTLAENIVTRLPDPASLADETMSIDDARALQRAQSNTYLRRLVVDQSQMSDSSRRALVRASERSNMSLYMPAEGASPVNAFSFNRPMIANATHNEASASLLLMLSAAFLFLYLLYRVLSPLKISFSNIYTRLGLIAHVNAPPRIVRDDSHITALIKGDHDVKNTLSL